MKERVIYYNTNGKVNKFETFINNNSWVMPLFVLVMVTLMGFIESI